MIIACQGLAQSGPTATVTLFSIVFPIGIAALTDTFAVSIDQQAGYFSATPHGLFKNTALRKQGSLSGIASLWSW